MGGKRTKNGVGGRGRTKTHTSQRTRQRRSSEVVVHISVHIVQKISWNKFVKKAPATRSIQMNGKIGRSKTTSGHHLKTDKGVLAFFEVSVGIFMSKVQARTVSTVYTRGGGNVDVFHVLWHS